MCDRFEASYASEEPPQWDIGRPQRAVTALAELGEFSGPVLDLGCGTGENAVYLASLGFEVTGVELIEAALQQARRKALVRGATVDFRQEDALALPPLGPFATILDCGLFHVLADDQRPAYLHSLERVSEVGTALHLLCFSDHEPGATGPRRITRDDLCATFQPAWHVERIRSVRLESNSHPEGARSWLATMTRR